ncbi:sensor histidine kinase [Dietzia sp. SLG310A2-38A2]|uniref:GAF domain-containing sensor histidine kinase n=1 Tax=Dietzia sp. SLG310A2-38A2 TaxID=1630643 RepID=UPI0015F97C72|nr:ATP-binding protein [Dietzia sp. SLG310A2-38A2]MBB1030598.1 sensor histidine kinase [Dietzia sp. SLG310A2-38A2]
MTEGPTDLDSLLGLRSVKRSFFDQYRAAESRLRRSMHALDRVSGALVRTAEGPEELMLSVLRVAYDQLDAEWALVALRDGQLPSVEPRHVIVDPEGRFVAFEGRDLAPVPEGLPKGVVNVLLAVLRGGRSTEVAEAGGPDAVTVPLILHGGVIGGLASWRHPGRPADDIDTVVLRILAAQAAVALHNSVLFRDQETLLARAEEAYEEARGHVVELSRRNSELELAHRELDAAHRQRILDVERSRMARELHDSVSQLVLGAGMHLQLGLDAVGQADQQRPLLEKAVHLTDQAVEQLRSVIYALRTIDDGRLSRLIEDLCRLHVPSSMTTEVWVLGSEVPTTPGIEHELLRIAGEALSNAARHSRGNGVVVTLDFGDEAVGLTVEDDGVGRPEDLRNLLEGVRTGSPEERHGLVNMRERAELVGGVMRIAESDLGGVAITVVAPGVDGLGRRPVR